MTSAADLEFLPIFRDESVGRLDSFVETLYSIDPDRPAPEAVDLLRREAHTIKGAAGMVGLTRAHQLALALEEVCSAAQEDGGALGADLIEILGRAATALRAAVEGEEGATDAGTDAEAVGLVAAPEDGSNGHHPDALPEPLKLLVVDDSLTLRELQRRILERAGYSVEVACDGQDALRTLEHDDTIAMLVTDLDMPELDGFGLVEAVRADGRLVSMPVIIVTAREADGDRRRGIELGADEYVVKGAYHEQTLLETIARLARA